MTENQVSSFPKRGGSAMIPTIVNQTEWALGRWGSIPGLLGCSLLLGSVIPKNVAMGAAAVLILTPFLRLVAKKMKVIKHPNLENVALGRLTARFDGDFVVFLIGARYNGPMLSKDFGELGKAFEDMIAELNAKPELGCLGCEPYGGLTNGSDTVSVQYWRSAEHLGRYAAASSDTHPSVWKRFMLLAKRDPEIGFWHETFVVRAGEYENIYVNMPLVHMASATGAIVERASGPRVTMKGRMGKGEGDVAKEWPKEMGAPNY